jgi:hypothetical protein
MPTVQFYLAFANQPSGPLPDLTREANELRRLLGEAAQRGLCAPLMGRHVREFCSLGDLFDMFQGRPEGEVGVLHFAGHGSPTFLDFSPSGPGPSLAHAEPLAQFLGRQNLQLVFLNACSTRAQAQYLLDAGVPAVLVTARAIQDVVAADFAVRFPCQPV